MLCFASSFYNLLLCWRLLEIMPLPDKYPDDISTGEFIQNTTRLIYSFVNLHIKVIH